MSLWSLTKSILSWFYAAPTAPGRWTELLKWWELRRIVYNLWILGWGVFGFILFFVMVEGGVEWLPPPFFFAMWIVLFFILANICYTAGELVELLIRLIGNYNPYKLRKVLFTSGMIFSALISASPGLIASVALITGDRMASPYASFTTVEPEESDLIGRYYLDVHTYQQMLDEGAGLDSLPYFELLENYRFKYWGMPAQYDTIEWSGTDGKITVEYTYAAFSSWDWDFCKTVFLNGNGVWELDPPSDYQDHWMLDLTFDQEVSRSSGLTFPHSSTVLQFDLRREAPPYELYYLIGDPDSWRGVVYIQDTTAVSEGEN